MHPESCWRGWKAVFCLFFSFFLTVGLAGAAEQTPRVWQGRGYARPEGFSARVSDISAVEAIAAGEVNLSRVQQEDEERERRGGPYRFAVRKPVEVDVTTGGTWEQIDSETWMWRLHIVSAGATSLSLGFTTYDMPAGGKLFIYSQDGKEVLGPYTERDNARHGQLWTPLIHSDDVVVELDIPLAEVGNLKLTLGAINHGYRGIQTLQPVMDELASYSEWCEIDVNCSYGDGWRDQIRSVALYQITLDDGTFLCTGSLVNNTAQDNKPYFLTAFHCFDEYQDGYLDNPGGAAASMVLTWNYQAATCSGGISEPTQEQTGAYFRAAYCPSDFTLVELDEAPACDARVYCAGWDRSSAAPSSGVAIHHPEGDLKKISIEYNALTFSSFSISPCVTANSHLLVSDWDVGTSEGGSSGCPLFSPQKRIVGQLSGGKYEDLCDHPRYDFFGRFYTSWTGGSTSSERLRDWLDPLSTGVLVLDGNNPTRENCSCYCSGSGGGDEFVSRVIVGDIDNTSGESGYADYTAISTNMQKGIGYPITVTNGRAYSGDQCGIWADWNQDCDFDDPCETISISGGPATFTATITPPEAATDGSTRMRVRVMYTGSVNSCGAAGYGEVEDYTLIIGEGNECNNVTIGTGTSTWSFPMHTYYHDSRTQVIYLASEIGQPGRIAALALDVAAVPGQVMNNWTIRMKHTTKSSYNPASFEATGWTIVYQTNEPIGGTGWRTFNLTTPFEYNGVDNLMVDFSHNNSSWSSDGTCRVSTPGGTRSATAYTDSGYGDPLNWSGTTSPTVSGSTYVPNVRLTVCEGNHFPQLSGGIVNPGAGEPSTNFNYDVNYYDPDGDAPTVKDVYIDDVAHTMTLQSGSDSNGTYRYGPTTLGVGPHTYYFYFEDGIGGTARLPSAGSYTGPTVNAVTHTLTVASFEPDSGVTIGVNPLDNGGQGGGITEFERIYDEDTVVTLTAPSVVDGNGFKEWQRDSVYFTNTLAANVTMDTDYTLTAVYEPIFLSPMDVDWNSDGIPNFYDFGYFSMFWRYALCTSPDWCGGRDLDRDGVVDIDDLQTFAAFWLWPVADLDMDGIVNMPDLAAFSMDWGSGGCENPEWCYGCDFDKSGIVDIYDLAILAEYWLLQNELQQQ